MHLHTLLLLLPALTASGILAAPVANIDTMSQNELSKRQPDLNGISSNAKRADADALTCTQKREAAEDADESYIFIKC